MILSSKAQTDKVFAPYEVYIANTHPESTEEIIKDVLMDIAHNMPDGMKLKEELRILEIECQTKEIPGKKPFSKSWRVRVDNKFKDHIRRPEAIPSGWTSRRYYPKREPRRQVPSLHPNKKLAIDGASHLIPGL